ncbi:hypothetical protein HY745_04150, partial [Candidatus Desantisbacteria bacterium]|nr:hypothetical protein [Candidatus Desantisbacteria bacterium]
MKIIKKSFYLTIIIVFFYKTFIFSQEFNYEFNIEIIEKPAYRFIRDDYLLNPDRNILPVSSWINRLYGDVRLKLNYQKIRFISQARPIIISDKKDTETRNIIDDMYLDINFNNKTTFYFGKKNIFYGI